MDSWVDAARQRAEALYHAAGLPAPWEVPPWEVPDEIARRAGLPTWSDTLDWLRGRTGDLDVDGKVRRIPRVELDEDDEGWFPDVVEIGRWLYELYEWLESEPSLKLWRVDWSPDTPFSLEWGEIVPGPAIVELEWATFEAPAPYAARVLDPMGHGGVAGPGPGSPDVLIGGLHALRMIDQHVCPCVVPLPHLAATWVPQCTDVLINGMPALRAGDFLMEVPAGPNPIVAGCTTVEIGEPAPPVRFGAAKVVGHGPPEGGRYWIRFEKLEAMRIDGWIVLGVGTGGPFVGFEGAIETPAIEGEVGWYRPGAFFDEFNARIDADPIRIDDVKVHLYPNDIHVHAKDIEAWLDAKQTLEDLIEIIDVLS